MIPLFPHYAGSSYESAVERVEAVVNGTCSRNARRCGAAVLRRAGSYIDALAASARRAPRVATLATCCSAFTASPSIISTSPTPTKQHCMIAKDCCAGHHTVHATCYRAQCLKTVQAFVAKTGLTTDQYSVLFPVPPRAQTVAQVPTPTKWSKPCPSVESRSWWLCARLCFRLSRTLEEIGIRAREDFVAAGGEDLHLIPCMNEHPRWIETLEIYSRRHLAELQSTTGVIPDPIRKERAPPFTTVSLDGDYSLRAGSPAKAGFFAARLRRRYKCSR